MSIEKTFFDTFEGQEISAYTLTNAVGASLTVLSFGGIVNRLKMPDRNGVLSDLVTGFDSVSDYLADASNYSGAIIGRTCNRLTGGFSIDGKYYPVVNNEKGKTHLHGGVCGFNRKIWQVEPVEENGRNSLILTAFSPDGEEGYPGNLSIKVTYSLGDDNVMTIHYEADTDADTVVSLTNHAYYNLNGYDGDSVMTTELKLYADAYDVPDEYGIPMGEPVPVEGTAFDYRMAKPIGHPLDHNFILPTQDQGIRPAAEAWAPQSGRCVTVYTDYPAIQIYTAGAMNGSTNFKGNVPQRPLHAVCFETQFSPNTPNRPYLPSCILRRGEHYDHTAVFAFGVR